MAKTLDYKIVKDINPDLFEERVKKLIVENEYEPLGSLVVTRDPSNSGKLQYSQALIKKG